LEFRRVLFRSRAHPQRIGRDRPDLRDVQDRPDDLCLGADALECLDCVAAADEELRLELVAAARGESRTEVGEPLVPRTGVAELLRAVRRIEAVDGVLALRRRLRTEELVRSGVAALHPDLRDVVPVREDADAVTGREDLVEMRRESGPRQVLRSE